MSKRKAKSSLYKKTLDYYVSLKAIYFGLVGGKQKGNERTRDNKNILAVSEEDHAGYSMHLNGKRKTERMNHKTSINRESSEKSRESQ